MRVCCADLATGRPDEPLEAARAAMLRVHYNGTSPVPWDERLGRAAVPYTIRPLWEVGGGAACCLIPHTIVFTSCFQGELSHTVHFAHMDTQSHAHVHMHIHKPFHLCALFLIPTHAHIHKQAHTVSLAPALLAPALLHCCQVHPDGGLLPSTLVVVQRRYPVIFCRRAEADGARPTYMTRRAMERDEGAAERHKQKVWVDIGFMKLSIG